MTENNPRIRIERAYGAPGEMGWSYHAIDHSNGSIILEGEVERNDKGGYHMLLRPNRGGRIELGDVEDPHVADSKLLVILKLKASELLASKK